MESARERSRQVCTKKERDGDGTKRYLMLPISGVRRTGEDIEIHVKVESRRKQVARLI